MSLALALTLIAVAYLLGILTGWWEVRAEERHIDRPVRYVLGDKPFDAHVDDALAMVDDDAAWIRALRSDADLDEWTESVVAEQLGNAAERGEA